MKSNIRLGRFFGIEVGLHYSWFLIAFLITMSLASQFHAGQRRIGARNVIWALSIVTAILFFAGLLAHEMSHALVARAHGLTTRAITLFALGGVAQIESEPADARTEFWVGIVGPFSSAVIGVICFLIAYGAGWRMGSTPNTPIDAMFVWLGYINLMLAAFNMIPGFPLDGGRILRSIIWWSTGNGERVHAAGGACRPGGGAAVHRVWDFPLLWGSRLRRAVDRLHRLVSAAGRRSQLHYSGAQREA